MPNILFASNNISHWPLSVSDSLASTFDSTKVPYSIKLSYIQSIASPVFAVATGDVTWFHFRVWANSFDINDKFHMLKVFDANNNLLIQVNKFTTGSAYNLGLQVFDGATNTDVVAGFPLNPGVMNIVDVRFEVTAGGVLDGELYVNGGLAAVGAFASNPNSYGKPTHFALGAAFTSGAGFQYMSEILVADGDTRNARMSLLRPTGAGFEADWVGVEADLADDDPTSGMTSIVAAERQTLTIGTYTGASNISSVLVATQSVAGANAPQNLRHTVRMSSVNYDSAGDIALSDVLQYDITDFQINPGTSLPWVSGDLTALEIGFISKI